MSAFDPKRTSCRGAKYRNLHRIDLAVSRPGGEMQRRGENVRPAKSRRTPGPKARKASKLSTAEFQEQVAALRHDLKEAREQQTATTEVLKVIASSPGKLHPVFNSMLENATRICAANFGLMYLYDSDYWRPVAQLHVPPQFSNWRLAGRASWAPGPGPVPSAKSNSRCKSSTLKLTDCTSKRTHHALHLSNSPARALFWLCRCLGMMS